MQDTKATAEPKAPNPTLGEFMWANVVKRTYKYPWPLSKLDGWLYDRYKLGYSYFEMNFASPLVWCDFWWRRRMALKAWTKQNGPFKPSIWKTKTYLSDWRDQGDEGVSSFRVVVDQYGRVLNRSERMPDRMDFPYHSPPSPPQASLVVVGPFCLSGEGDRYIWGLDADGKDIVEAR